MREGIWDEENRKERTSELLMTGREIFRFQVGTARYRLDPIPEELSGLRTEEIAERFSRDLRDESNKRLDELKLASRPRLESVRVIEIREGSIWILIGLSLLTLLVTVVRDYPAIRKNLPKVLADVGGIWHGKTEFIQLDLRSDPSVASQARSALEQLKRKESSQNTSEEEPELDLGASA